MMPRAVFALPDPGQHPPEAWPGVVERVRERMRRMDVEGITNDDSGASSWFRPAHLERTQSQEVRRKGW